MGCSASQDYVWLTCRGDVSNPKDCALGTVTATMPVMLPDSRLVRLHHIIHEELIKQRTVIKGRPSVFPWEVFVPEGVSPGQLLEITLKEEANSRNAYVRVLRDDDE